MFVYGNVSFSDQAWQQLLEHRVSVVLLSQGGHHVLGRLAAVDDSTVLVRVGQVRLLSDPARKLELARESVLAKIAAQRDAARHYQRHGKSAAGAFQRKLDELWQAARSARELNSLRGYEGAAAAAWYQLFGQLLDPPWTFTERSRRPPRDPVNALLSLAATWLCARAVAELQAAGTEVALGALHEFRAGRPALACDLMEPWRVPAVERWVLDFCHHRCLKPEEFVSPHEQGTRLPEGTYGRTLAHWESFWVEANLGSQMTQTVQRWCQRFRQQAKLPTP